MNVNMYLYCVTVCTQAIGDTHTVSARGGVEEQSECQLCTQVKEGGNYAGEKREREREGGREKGPGDLCIALQGRIVFGVFTNCKLLYV